MPKLKLTAARSRPAHLAALKAPEGCEAPVLVLRAADGTECLAEKDPCGSAYQVMLPAMAAGESCDLEIEEKDGAEPAAGVACEQAEGRVAVSLAGSPFMTFHHSADYPKPVINPILTPGGTNMLREPMAAYTKAEHPWQRGLTLMQGAINGVDCWNEPDPQVSGRTEQDSLEVLHGPLSLTLASENSWYQGDRPLMADSRSYRLFATARETAILDIALTLKAVHWPVAIGGTKEAGFLCIRVNPTMNASDGGTMRNVYGAADETGCWSKSSHWMDYYGPVGDETVGFAIFDHADNFRYPTTWHVRGYGLFAPNPWMFREDHQLAENESLTFRWRVVIHTGDTDSAGIPGLFLDYADGTRAAWQEG